MKYRIIKTSRGYVGQVWEWNCGEGISRGRWTSVPQTNYKTIEDARKRCKSHYDNTVETVVEEFELK